MHDEFARVVARSHTVITANEKEWMPRYCGYIDRIQQMAPAIKLKRKGFRAWEPFKVYMTVGKMASKNDSALEFQLRYSGQQVGCLKYKKNDNSGSVWLEIDEKTHKRNYDSFGYSHGESGLGPISIEWNSADGKNFREYFLKLKNGVPKGTGARKNNEEHRLESRLLTEFGKTESAGKSLPGIQPVTLGGIRFGMTTPLKASEKGDAPTYSGSDGGGIDILARRKIDGKDLLYVIELKDERENPKHVVKQAIKYAVFIRELLRSDAGEKWWNLFGFTRKLPKSLSIAAMSLMPAGENNDFSFCSQRLSLPDKEGKGYDDCICLDAAYFTENGEELRIITKGQLEG